MRILMIILGVLLLVGGIYCMFAPVATYSALSWLIGLAMVVEGIASVVMWNDWRKQGLASGLTLVGAIVSILLGGFLLGSFVAQFAVDVFIAYLIAIWLIVAGVARVVAAIGARNYQREMGASAARTNWGGLMVLGVAIAILGILCFFNPLSVAVGVGLLLGLAIACVGAGLIIRAIRMQPDAQRA